MSDNWISVSEKLPENDNTSYLIYGKIHFVPDHVDDVSWYYGYGIGRYNKEFGWLATDDMTGNDVMAWMPLPEPFIK